MIARLISGVSTEGKVPSKHIPPTLILRVPCDALKGKGPATDSWLSYLLTLYVTSPCWNPMEGAYHPKLI